MREDAYNPIKILIQLENFNKNYEINQKRFDQQQTKEQFFSLKKQFIKKKVISHRKNKNLHKKWSF